MYTPEFGTFYGLFTGVTIGTCVGINVYKDIRKHNEQMSHESNQ